MGKKIKQFFYNNRIKMQEFFQGENVSYFMRKRVFSVVFTVLLMAYFGYNLYHNFDAIEKSVSLNVAAVAKEEVPVRKGIASVENVLTTEISGRMNYVEVFSYMQKVLGKREINNFAYIKDETGSLHYASFYKEAEKNCFEYAMSLKRLQDYANAKGTDVLFVVAPSKYVANDGRMLEDMPVNDPQVIVDETLFYMNRLGVETLDLNMHIPCGQVPYEEAFFKTDHHWTVPAAFYSTKVLADELNKRFGYDLDTETYLGEDAYKQVIYKEGMLGSMGRGSGANFSGVDDMTALYPNFTMDFYRKSLEENDTYTERRGDIIGTLILPEVLATENIYKDSQYSLYLNGLRSYESIVNESNPDGKKIFMIRDSYFSPVMAFLAPTVGQIDAMWSLEESDEINIEQYITDNDFDCIIMEIYPYNIGDDAFRFFTEEE